MGDTKIHWKLRCGVVGFAHTSAALLWPMWLWLDVKKTTGSDWTPLAVFLAVLVAAHIAWAIWATMHSFGWVRLQQQQHGRLYVCRGMLAAYGLSACTLLIAAQRETFAIGLWAILGGLGTLVSLLNELSLGPFRKKADNPPA